MRSYMYVECTSIYRSQQHFTAYCTVNTRCDYSLQRPGCVWAAFPAVELPIDGLGHLEARAQPLLVETHPSSDVRWHFNFEILINFVKFKHKMLRYRRETALQSALVLTKSGRLELGDNILGYYRSIFNHCDIRDLQSYRIRREKRKINFELNSLNSTTLSVDTLLTR